VAQRRARLTSGDGRAGCGAGRSSPRPCGLQQEQTEAAACYKLLVAGDVIHSPMELRKWWGSQPPAELTRMMCATPAAFAASICATWPRQSTCGRRLGTGQALGGPTALALLAGPRQG